MNITAGIDLIKSFESCQLEAYQKFYNGIADVPTIGWGMTYYPNGLTVKLGDKISQDVADSDLLTHCEALERQILGFTHTLLTDNQMSAVLSLVYNIGFNDFKSSTLLIKLNFAHPDFNDVAAEFLKWNHVKGIVVDGLTRRRIAERELFLK